MLAAGIALAIAAASFAAAGGLRLERTTNVLIAAMLASAALVVAAIIQRPWTRDAPLYGGGALLAFAVLAVGTALSVIWSLAPSDSWIEAARTFAYLACSRPAWRWSGWSRRGGRRCSWASPAAA